MLIYMHTEMKEGPYITLLLEQPVVVRRADSQVITVLIIEFIASKNNRRAYSSILETQGVWEQGE